MTSSLFCTLCWKPLLLLFRDLLNQHFENRRRQSWISQAPWERPYKLQQEKEGSWDNRGNPAVPEPAILFKSGIWHQGKWHSFLLWWFCQLTDHKDRLNSHRFGLTESEMSRGPVIKPLLGLSVRKGRKLSACSFLVCFIFSQLLGHW